MIIYLILTNIFAIFLITMTRPNRSQSIKLRALISSTLICTQSLFLLIFFQNDSAYFQFFFELGWFPFFNINYVLGVDGLSLFFIILSTILVPLCILSS